MIDLRQNSIDAGLLTTKLRLDKPSRTWVLSPFPPLFLCCLDRHFGLTFALLSAEGQHYFDVGDLPQAFQYFMKAREFSNDEELVDIFVKVLKVQSFLVVIFLNVSMLETGA
jgi:hypothetical protein